MRKILIITTALSILLFGCGKDNFDEPNSTITGMISYNGNPVGVRGTGEVVQLQLYQVGFPLNAHVPVYVGQDGSFTAKVFDGNYKLVAVSDNGPWLNATTDTVRFELNGNATVNYEVTPYFIIENLNLSLDSDEKITAGFSINKVVPEATVDYYMLLISKTAFVDDATNIFRKDYKDGATMVNIAEDVSQLAELNGSGPLFARVGVRATGADQAYYSEIIKIK